MALLVGFAGFHFSFVAVVIGTLSARDARLEVSALAVECIYMVEEDLLIHDSQVPLSFDLETCKMLGIITLKLGQSLEHPYGHRVLPVHPYHARLRYHINQGDE